MSRHIEHVLKAISYRVLATISTVAISFLVTGQIRAALAIGSIEVAFKIFLFYCHERVWLVFKKSVIPDLSA